MFGETNASVGGSSPIRTTYDFLADCTHNQLANFSYERLKTLFIPPNENDKEEEDK